MDKIKYKLIKKNQIVYYNFSLDELKIKFNLPNDADIILLINYLRNKKFSIAVACEDIDFFLFEFKKNMSLENIERYSQFKKEVLKEIKSFNDFLLNVNFDKNDLFLNMKKGIYPFSKKEIVEIKRKLKEKFIKIQ